MTLNPETKAVRWLARHHAVFAVALAVAVTTAGLVWNTRVAGGADSYGYVSEADLWLAGELRIRQDFAADAPWPQPQLSLAPLGYRPGPDGVSIVPVHAPGLPLLMALAKLVVGHCAVFWIVPICGGLFALATYAIGRRIGRPMVGLAAALLVALSPTTQFMLLNPMSDLPAAAAWGIAMACLLGETRFGAVAAGVAAAVGILVRPNLAPLAGLLALWLAWRDVATGRWATRRMAAPWFFMTASVGALAVGIFNDRLYGSPFTSGYGSLDYALRHIPRNVRSYLAWLRETETPLAYVGLLSLVVPARRLWPTPRGRQVLWLFAGCVATVWVPYLFFTQFDAWWYLRYLLTFWPVMMIGTASIAAAVYRSNSAWLRWIAIGLIAGLAWHARSETVRRDLYSFGAGERKYIDVARLVQDVTSHDDIILTLQHSGSVRYYAGRMTMRWDLVEAGVLDRAVAWFQAEGHHPFFLLEDWEADLLRRRYGRTDAVARVDWAPVMRYQARGIDVSLYDAIARTAAGETRLVTAPPRSESCVHPAPQVRFDNR